VGRVARGGQGLQQPRLGEPGGQPGLLVPRQRHAHHERRGRIERGQDRGDVHRVDGRQELDLPGVRRRRAAKSPRRREGVVPLVGRVGVAGVSGVKIRRPRGTAPAHAGHHPSHPRKVASELGGERGGGIVAAADAAVGAPHPEPARRGGAPVAPERPVDEPEGLDGDAPPDHQHGSYRGPGRPPELSDPVARRQPLDSVPAPVDPPQDILARPVVHLVPQVRRDAERHVHRTRRRRRRTPGGIVPALALVKRRLPLPSASPLASFHLEEPPRLLVRAAGAGGPPVEVKRALGRASRRRLRIMCLLLLLVLLLLTEPLLPVPRHSGGNHGIAGVVLPSPRQPRNELPQSDRFPQFEQVVQSLERHELSRHVRDQDPRDFVPNQTVVVIRSGGARGGRGRVDRHERRGAVAVPAQLAQPHRPDVVAGVPLQDRPRLRGRQAAAVMMAVMMVASSAGAAPAGFPAPAGGRRRGGHGRPCAAPPHDHRRGKNLFSAADALPISC
jgi:hypothetical protein